MANFRGTRGRSGRSASGRSPTEWSTTAQAFTALNAGQGLGVVILQNARIVEMTQPSIVRIRGALAAGGQVAGHVDLVYGLIVLNKSWPIATQLSPTLDGDADWMHWGHILAPARVAPVVSAIDGDTSGGAGHVIDSKSKRKVNEDEALYLWVHNRGIIAVNYAFSFRFLLMQVTRKQ